MFICQIFISFCYSVFEKQVFFILTELRNKYMIVENVFSVFQAFGLIFGKHIVLLYFFVSLIYESVERHQLYIFKFMFVTNISSLPLLSSHNNVR